MYIIDKIKMIIRCWRYRFKSEVASIKYVRNLPKKDSIVLDIGANKGVIQFICLEQLVIKAK